ncbi:hypothetical protein BDF20DRAFT_858419 [Mycotypha africana]|uniref:uncharacterized protein n=1 Tax=Mycotypha africana TaxID=64632 RepID=UPI0023002734|nr:uncharacterized protein BDF20DRAFT_858419 [Mycotypha africana]KAI8984182.1 hypothetical protein BDF20DRAFT_858419 [Mycotypha africana]
MISLLGFIVIYLIGGITFVPLLAIAGLIYLKGISTFKRSAATKASVPEVEPITRVRNPDDVVVKKGWIRLTNQYQPKMPEVQTSNNNGSNGIISGIQSYVSGNGGNQPNNKKGVMYAVLKHRTLYCYETEDQQEVAMVLPMQEYSVSLFPIAKAKPEGEVYGKRAVIRLTPRKITTTVTNNENREKDDQDQDINEPTTAPAIVVLPEDDITCQPDRVLYLTCTRNIDKEDWYFGLLEAQHFSQEATPASPDESSFIMMDSTHFDQSAMDELIRQVQCSPSHRETAWVNAILGRLFLGMYKTDRLKNFVEQKIRKKIDKTKRPTFLDEIKVRDVDVGKSVPFFTNPRLLSLSPEGELIVETKMEYQGGLTIEIETDFNWSYSSLMKPIRMKLVLAVKLKKMVGRLMFKIKAPPTNRYWISFFEMPDMEWKILPVVADKQIKWNIVTNTIESRIREVMAETFVLPNMDDTSFCPSGGKGGIFGKYVKVEVRPPKSNGAFDVASINSDRRGSTVSTSSTLSGSLSLKSTQNYDPITNAPTVPIAGAEKVPAAADALKLKNRRAESVFELNDNSNNSSMKGLVGTKPMESSQSLPQMQTSAKRKSIIEDGLPLKSVEQTSTMDSKTSGTSSSTGGILSNLRKRITKNSDSDSESDESEQLSNTNTATDISQTASTNTNRHASNSSNGTENKKTSWLRKAENFLSNRKSNDIEDIDKPLNDEKKEIYAQRLADMRKRAEEKRQSDPSRYCSSYSIPPPPINDIGSSTNAHTESAPASAAAAEPLLNYAPPPSSQSVNDNSNVINDIAKQYDSSIPPNAPVLPPRHDMMPISNINDTHESQEHQSATIKGDILSNSPIVADPEEIGLAKDTPTDTHLNNEVLSKSINQQQQQHQVPVKPQKPPHLARTYSNTPPPLPKTARPKISPPLNRATKPTLPPPPNKPARLANNSHQNIDKNYLCATQQAPSEQPASIVTTPPQLPPRKDGTSEPNEDPEVVSLSPPSAPPRKH